MNDDIWQALSPLLQQHVGPEVSLEARMLAAQGLLAAPPRDIILGLCCLSVDAQPEVQHAACTTLQDFPDKLLKPILAQPLPASALALLLHILPSREAACEILISNPLTPNEALAAFAPQAPANLVERLAENQERCRQSEALVRGLFKNPVILRSSVDRLTDFLVRLGIVYEDMPEFEQAMERLSPAQIHDAFATTPMPEEVSILLQETEPDLVPLGAALVSTAETLETPAESTTEPEASLDKPPRESVQKKISKLNPAQKVALAIKGNKEARSILVRDSNKMVSLAAIRNPRLTEQEVLMAAKNRMLHDEVLRVIYSSREMTRSYGVKLALTNNPKTPLQVVTRFLGALRPNDLRQLASSKSVSSAVSSQAKNLLAKKLSHG